jgi:Flp pilus assembly protein TadG
MSATVTCGPRRFFGPDGQGGQAIVMVAITFMALLFAVGLAIDAGQLFAAKRTMQEAADAGALAGAVVLYQGGTMTLATTAAIADTTRNGFTNGVNGTTVTVNGCVVPCTATPTSGLYMGDPNHVEVVIIRQVQTTLVPAEAAFNPVRARGVAGAESLNNGYAIMALGTSCATTGLSVSSNENIHVSGGGILSNSCNASSVSGFASGQDFQICAIPPLPCTPNPYALDLVGGTAGDAFPASITVHTGIAAKPDPFSGYPRPDGHSYNGVALLPTNPALIGGTSTAPEGIYTGSLSGVALCHGIYILAGGGMGGDITRDTNPLHLDPNTNTPCDGNVLIFNTVSGFPGTVGTCSDMGGSGNHPITLRPMITGPYANMGIFQDPLCTTALTAGGSMSVDVGGTIYLPNGTINLNGNPATITGGQLIAKTLAVQNGNLNISYSSGTTASPKLPRLAE